MLYVSGRYLRLYILQHCFGCLPPEKTQSSATKKIENQTFIYSWWVHHIFLLSSMQDPCGLETQQSFANDSKLPDVQWHFYNYTTVTIMPLGADLSSLLGLPRCFRAGTQGPSTTSCRQLTHRGAHGQSLLKRKVIKKNMSRKLKAALWKGWNEMAQFVPQGNKVCLT